MELLLKRIKKESFDTVMKTVLDRFEASKEIVLEDEYLENNSELVSINGNNISLIYNLNEYEKVVDSDDNTYIKLAKVGMLLHKDTKDKNNTPIPSNILYEKEVWSYLSFKVFFDIVKKLRLDDDNKLTKDKIERFYFNIKSRSRTGLLFIWSMIDLLDSEDNEDLSITAFHFIDPVKAIYERTISRNPIVIRAFVQSIINLNKDSRIKNKKYKVKVPNNISCFARINILDAYSYDELVDVVTTQMRELLQLS